MKGRDVKVYSVWVPILPSDGEFAVGRATKNLADGRVTHYWDAHGELVKSFAPVLGLGDRPAWDVYLLYDKDTQWTDSPPKPVFWQEQLGISEETQLDVDKMTAEIDKLLKSVRKLNRSPPLSRHNRLFPANRLLKGGYFPAHLRAAGKEISSQIL